MLMHPGIMSAQETATSQPLRNASLPERVAHVHDQADLDQAIKVQEQKLDLQSRFEALQILQDRIEQLEKYRDHRPLSLSLGLYQGEILERKLREEYFDGVREVMLKPVSQTLEAFLADWKKTGQTL